MKITPVPVPVFASTLAVLVGLATGAAAQSVSLTPVADATLYESEFGDVANGAGNYFFIGTTVRDTNIRRSLLRFDLSSIPPTARVTSAGLELYASRVQPDPFVATLHHVTRSWSEGPSKPFGDEGQGDSPLPGDTTWLHTLYPGEFWATPGGDFDPAVLTSTNIGDVGAYAFPTSPAFVSEVQGWLDNPGTNFGILIRGDEGTSGTAKRFDSRQIAAVDKRPRLVVGYLCIADINADGFVNGDDYDAFASLFESGDLGADLNHDGFVNGDDYDFFASAFEAGC